MDRLSLPVHLVSPAQRRHAAKVRAFSEHLAQVLAKEGNAAAATHDLP